MGLENITVTRPKPVAPGAKVKSPNEPAVVTPAPDTIAFVDGTRFTEATPPVLSTKKSKTVPLTAPRAAPSKVPVGKVILVIAAEVLVM